MRNYRKSRRLPLVVLAILGAGTLLLAGAGGHDRLKRVGTYLRLFLEGRIESISDFSSDLAQRQMEWIELVPPGMPLLIQDIGVTWFNPRGLPSTLCSRLVPTTYHGVTVYPVIVYEDPDTRAHVFVNVEGDEICSVPAPDDYDPRWLALEKHPDLYDRSRTDEEIEELLYRYDPARVAIEYKLITKHDLFDYIARRLVPAQDVVAGGTTETAALEAVPVQSMSEGSPQGEQQVDGPQCAAIEPGSDGVHLTIAYPEGYSNRLDLFSCTNLLDYLWRLRLDSMDTPAGTSELGWVDTNDVPRTRFYAVAAANCDEQTDPDDDGLTSAREKLLHGTDPGVADTDGDGMPDGWEATHMLNPLADDRADDPDADGWNNLQEYKRGGNPGVSFLPDTNNALNLILMTPVRNAD